MKQTSYLPYFSWSIVLVIFLSLNFSIVKRKRWILGFRATPTAQKTSQDVCLETLHKASLYKFQAWTWSIFIMQQPSSDFRYLLWGLDWTLWVCERLQPADYCLLWLAPKSLLISILICQFKKTEYLASKTSFPRGLGSMKKASGRKALPLPNSWTNHIFFKTPK